MLCCDNLKTGIELNQGLAPETYTARRQRDIGLVLGPQLLDILPAVMHLRDVLLGLSPILQPKKLNCAFLILKKKRKLMLWNTTRHINLDR